MRRMAASPSSEGALPTLKEIEASSRHGALTVSMIEAWRIAADVGLMDSSELKQLTEAQLRLIDHLLARSATSLEAKQDMTEMRKEYRQMQG